MTTNYFTGDSVILTTATRPFALAASTRIPADPTTVAITVIDPVGASTTYTYAAAQITRVSTGVYQKTVACPIPGRWKAKIVGTGVVSKTETVTWDVYDPLAP